MTSRREIIKAGVAGGLLAATGVLRAATKPLDILILGGTGFIGPHMVREALGRGHSVTLFNRGRTNSNLFPELETIKGDRSNDLTGLEGRQWDVVIDNSGYMARDVRASAELLKPNIGYYLFISSVSVYENYSQPYDESAAVEQLPGAEPEEFSWEVYGALKALAENHVIDTMGDEHSSVLRLTYVVGPGDHTDRFTYWPVRTSRGGEMIWPGSRRHNIQVIDVRDLATFAIDCAERTTAGVFNVATPVGAVTMGSLLDASLAVTGADMTPVWVSDEFVSSTEGTGGLFPIWHPQSGEFAHVSSADTSRAIAAGLQNRSVEGTVRDLMTWWDTLPEERVANARFGMTPEKEAELIAAWRALES